MNEFGKGKKVIEDIRLLESQLKKLARGGYKRTKEYDTIEAQYLDYILEFADVQDN